MSEGWEVAFMEWKWGVFIVGYGKVAFRSDPNGPEVYESLGAISGGWGTAFLCLHSVAVGDGFIE